MECIGLCNKDIIWQELSRPIKPKLLSKLIQKRQEIEAEKAEVENLGVRLYCPYLTIVENKVLVCKNPDCGGEAGRLAK